MYTLMALVALTTSVSTANLSQQPTWLADYGTAQARVTAAGKPMAVFVGQGHDGWSKVVRDGALDPELNKLLADKYVCLYVDTDTAAGRKLAGAFQVARRGLVISDRAGTSQAFSLSGDLTRAELGRALVKYADSAEAQVTETVVRQAPLSVQPAPAAYPSRPVYSQPTYAPSYYAPQYRVVPGYAPGGS
jgi:hypothetical protein